MTGLEEDKVARHEAMTDLQSSFFVEAGAGTGKTSILVGRVLEIIGGGAAPIEQVVMITFTEKAAGELRSRIRKELHGELRTATAARRALVEAAIEGLESAHIETIHSFVSRLLREHPLEAGIDPNFEQLDDVGAELDFQEQWTDWLWGTDDSTGRLVERCLRLRMTLESLRKAARLVARYPEVDPPAAQAAPPPAPAVLGRLRSDLEEGRPFTGDCRTESDRCFASFARLSALVDRIDALPEVLQESELYNCDFRFDKGNARNWNPGARDRVIAALEQASRELTDYRRRVVDHVMADLAQELSGFVRQSAVGRILRGRLSFEDLLIEMRRLLRSHPEVLARVRRRFRYILVDEFQDTDPVQADIVFLIASSSPLAPGSSWRDLTVVPGKLFLVGDPKQSIYRFRRADIEAYAEARVAFVESEKAGERAKVRAIGRNFRSVPGVVTWVNGVFGETIAAIPGFAGAQPDYLPIQASREAPPSAGVHYLIPATDDRAARIGELRAAEAEAVAQLVASIVGQWQVQDAVSKVVRDATWRDVCLLVETRTGIETYTEAFERAGIPFILDGGRSFFLRQEIRDVCNILRALDDPSDAVSLVAALKSDAFACSDVELLEYRVGGGQFSLVVDPPAGDAVADGLLRLRALYDQKASLSLPGFVDLVIRESCLAEGLLYQGQQQRASNLKLIVERAAAFAANEVDALRPFIRWLSNRQTEGVGEQEAPLNEFDDDVLRVMTIHGAKGLEFPVVILAKLAAGAGGTGESVAVDRTRNRLEFQVSANQRAYDTPGFQQAWAREQVFDDAETVRKLYVAATRARDHLVISNFNSDENPGLHRYLPSVRAPGDVIGAESEGPFGSRLILEKDLPPAPVRTEQARSVPVTIIEAWRDRQARIGAQLSKGPRYVAPSLLSQDLVKKPQETEPEDRSEPERDLDLQGDGQRALGTMAGSEGLVFTGSSSARSRGSLVHEVLYRCDLFSVQSGEEWTGRICAQRGVPALEPEIVRHVRSVLTSVAIKQVAAARRVEKELPVSWFNGESYVEGFVDLAFEEADGWVILDYKTDSVRTDQRALLDRYSPQVRAYRDALRAVGVAVTHAGLWLTETGEVVLLAPDESTEPRERR